MTRHTFPPRLLKAPDAAGYLGMGETKFQELVRDGRIQGPREVDGLVLWDVRDLDDFVDSLPRRGEPLRMVRQVRAV
ncbi:helix-turn-helix transcriptional regulator [Hyphomonas pacifica]|uniref:Helix-turn-helix domain-containing protein n=1 Tax=Hyphomonas pacifica TaxID=1280941 RepID=A0A8B2PQQ4_9PROT|nr:hypothetical protein [Hyphomonas pacifica]RAN30666.1 hypothetical protein HY3_05815 [Hyphomonas pacifica]